MWRKWWFRWGIGLTITGLALWLSFRRVDIGSLIKSISQVKWGWVGVAIFSQMLVIYLGGWRWQFLLSSKQKVSLARIFKLNILAQYANIVAPARLGEAVRAVMVAKSDRVPMGFSFGTVIIERIFDLFILALLWLLLPLVILVEHPAARIGMMVIFCLLLAVFLNLVAKKPELFWRISRRLTWLIPSRFREQFEEFVKSGLEAFKLFARWREAALIFGFSALLFVGQALGAYFMFFALNLKLTFLVALVILMMIKVGYIPPSAPGKVGIYEYAVIIALGIFGVNKDIALSYALVLHVTSFIPKILLGQFFIVKR